MPDKLLMKMQAAYDRIKKEAAAGVYGQRYVPAQGTKDVDNPDTRPDFPYIEDPEGYTTHVALELDDVEEDEKLKESLREQGDEEEALPGGGAEEAPPEAPPEGGEEIPPEGGEMPMDPAAGAPGMPGMPGGEEPLTSTQIGRVYELKKIYSRLASVETMLSRTTNTEMLEIRKLVGQSIDLFEVVISNFPQYKENVDEIIVTYYEFLDSVYGSLKTYFSEMSKEQKNDRS